MKVVTKVSDLNDVLRATRYPSEIVDCAGKCIKELVDAGNLFIKDGKVFVAVRERGVKEITPRICPIQDFCNGLGHYQSDMGGATLGEKWRDDNEIAQFAKQGGNFFDISRY